MSVLLNLRHKLKAASPMFRSRYKLEAAFIIRQPILITGSKPIYQHSHRHSYTTALVYLALTLFIIILSLTYTDEIYFVLGKVWYNRYKLLLGQKFNFCCEHHFHVNTTIYWTMISISNIRKLFPQQRTSQRLPSRLLSTFGMIETTVKEMAASVFRGRNSLLYFKTLSGHLRRKVTNDPTPIQRNNSSVGTMA